jgi:hypothetical protein
MDVQGVSLSNDCNVDVRGVCVPFHLCKLFLKWRIVRHPISSVPK